MEGVFLRKNYRILKKSVTVVIFLQISLRSGLIEDRWIFVSAYIFNLLRFCVKIYERKNSILPQICSLFRYGLLRRYTKTQQVKIS